MRPDLRSFDYSLPHFNKIPGGSRAKAYSPFTNSMDTTRKKEKAVQ
jgi:hypothetical protein